MGWRVRLTLAVVALAGLGVLAWYLFTFYGFTAILAPAAAAGVVANEVAKAAGTRPVKKQPGKPRRPGGVAVVEAPPEEGEKPRPKRPRRGGLS